MPSVSIRINNVHHPLVRSFHLKRDFTNPKKSLKVLVVEAGFDLHRDKANGMNSRLMGLLADLQDLMPHIEKNNGRFDCIDICPAEPRQETEMRLSA